MKKHKGKLAIAALVVALLLAISLLPVMTGLLTQGQINRQPRVTATPEPVYEEEAEDGL